MNSYAEIAISDQNEICGGDGQRRQGRVTNEEIRKIRERAKQNGTGDANDHRNLILIVDE